MRYLPIIFMLISTSVFSINIPKVSISNEQIAINNCVHAFKNYAIVKNHYDKIKITSTTASIRYNFDIINNMPVYNVSHTYSIYLTGKFFKGDWTDPVTVKCWAFPSGRLEKAHMYKIIG